MSSPGRSGRNRSSGGADSPYGGMADSDPSLTGFEGSGQAASLGEDAQYSNVGDNQASHLRPKSGRKNAGESGTAKSARSSSGKSSEGGVFSEATDVDPRTGLVKGGMSGEQEEIGPGQFGGDMGAEGPMESAPGSELY